MGLLAKRGLLSLVLPPRKDLKSLLPLSRMPSPHPPRSLRGTASHPSPRMLRQRSVTRFPELEELVG